MEIVSIERGKGLKVVLRLDNGEELEKDIVSSLRINSLSDAQYHASEELFWAVLWSELNKKRANLKDLYLARYLAHCRMYAKWALKGRKEKDTIEARNDFVVLVFSSDTDDVVKRAAVVDAFKGYCIEIGKQLTPDEAVKLDEYRRGEIETPDFLKDFVEKMFIYEKEGVYHDTIMDYLHELEEQFNVIEGILNAFRQRGIFLASMLSGSKKSIAEYEASFVHNSFGLEE